MRSIPSMSYPCREDYVQDPGGIISSTPESVTRGTQAWTCAQPVIGQERKQAGARFAILVRVMRVLFTILVLAFAGLLWATMAGARHVRRIRKRQRELARQERVNVAELTTTSAFAPPVPDVESSSRRLLRPKPLQSYF